MLKRSAREPSAWIARCSLFSLACLPGHLCIRLALVDVSTITAWWRLSTGALGFALTCAWLTWIRNLRMEGARSWSSLAAAAWPRLFAGAFIAVLVEVLARPSAPPALDATAVVVWTGSRLERALEASAVLSLCLLAGYMLVARLLAPAVACPAAAPSASERARGDAILAGWGAVVNAMVLGSPFPGAVDAVTHGHRVMSVAGLVVGLSVALWGSSRAWSDARWRRS